MLLGGPSGPFFTDYTVGFERNQQEIGLRDGLGRLQKPIRAGRKRPRYGRLQPESDPARSCGHLLVISVGTKICALDPWNASGKLLAGPVAPGPSRHDRPITAAT